MTEKEYGTYGPAVDAETFFTNSVYSVEGIDMVPSKEFSFCISKIMDRLGYSYEMIKHRQEAYAQFDLIHNSHPKDSLIQFTTGSRADGTSVYFESDFDIMFEVKQVICTDNPQNFMHDTNITLFQTEMGETSPGYTRLKLIRCDGMAFKEEIKSSFFKTENSSHYLSSELFMDSAKKMLYLDQPKSVRFGPRSGPSSPAKDGLVSVDRVFAFRFFFPNIIEKWVSRPRRKGWLSPETVHEISQLDGHLVPVGFKGSPAMNREWRICFTLAEMHLMRKLNESQLKVYILLKKLSKSVFKKICEKMTSYVMKNIVFWMCEIKCDFAFSQETIIDRLMDCIQYLRKCVQENNVCSYMIPDRNLLGEGLDEQQRNQVVNLLDELIKERGRMLLRCDKIRDAMFVMYKTPNNYREQGKIQDTVEKKVLMMNQIIAEGWIPGVSYDDLNLRLSLNKDYQSLIERIFHLVQYVKRLRKQEEPGEDVDKMAVLQEEVHQLLS